MNVSHHGVEIDYIFALNDVYYGGNGNPNTECFVKAKLYSSQIYDNNNLVRNFIPCKRKSDNKPGLYDLVEGKFYTNQGSGEDFIAGPDV